MFPEERNGALEWPWLSTSFPHTNTMSDYLHASSYLLLRRTGSPESCFEDKIAWLPLFAPCGAVAFQKETPTLTLALARSANQTNLRSFVDVQFKENSVLGVVRAYSLL